LPTIASARPTQKRGHGLRLSRYVLTQLLGPVALLTLLLASVIWLVSIMPLLDLVITKGQSAVTFLYLILLLLPTPLVIILPIAFFFAALFTLQRLQAESELVVMASAGYSLRQLAIPVLGAGAIVMAVTYACVLFLAPAGTRVIMIDGTVETGGKGGQQLQVLHFVRYTINMDQFSSPARYTLRKMNERYLGELLWPPEQGVSQKIRDQFFAQAHDRLSQPLYCLAFALIAMAAVVRGRRQRGSIAMRLTIASMVAAGLRIAGYGVMGIAQRTPALVVLFYLLPAIGAAGAIIVLMGYSPRAILARIRVHSLAKSARSGA
jgi:lipopolysaccharide export LptBFGC system permease protein LptF